jgi:hypothetical protein
MFGSRLIFGSHFPFRVAQLNLTIYRLTRARIMRARKVSRTD